jgi:teichuronic acid biosynthesis glycosyltransferase TuaC
MRVLMLSHLYPSRAQPTKGIFVHRQVLALRRAGIEVTVVAPVPKVPPGAGRFGNYRFYRRVPDRDFIDGVPVLYSRYVQPPRNTISGLAMEMFRRSVTQPLLGLAEEFRPDVLHSQMATPDGYAGGPIARELGVPLICSLLGSDVNVAPHRDRLSRRRTTEVLERADRVTAVSHALRTEAQKLVGRHIDVIYTGLDCSRFHADAAARLAAREMLGVAAESCLFGFVGNLIREKGVHDLVRAFAAVLPVQPLARLVMVGDGPEWHSLRRRTRRLGIADRVQFVGRVLHDDVPRLLNAMDVLVLPSHREGLPNVLVEAMACQKAVIATRVGGIPEVVEHERTGLLVNASDVSGLTSACILQAASPELRRSVALAGREAVVQTFSWERNAAAVCELYESVAHREESRRVATWS